MILALLLAAAISPEVPPPANVPSLSNFAPFVGACWSTAFDATTHDTHCFQSVYGGNHVRDHHEVTTNGEVVYSGETFYSVEGSRIVFTYFNSRGGVGRGTVEFSGKKLRFRGDMRPSPQEATESIDTDWQIVDDRHYEVRPLVATASTSGKKTVLIFSRNN